MFKAIKWVFIFLYHFFFIDQNTGSQSNTKFFANVGYIIWCILFPYAVIRGSHAPFDLWLVFGGVVIGNRTLNVMLQNKAGGLGNGDGSWKQTLNEPKSPVDDDSCDKPSPIVVVNTPQTVVVTATPAPVVPDTTDLVDSVPTHK